MFDELKCSVLKTKLEEADQLASELRVASPKSGHLLFIARSLKEARGNLADHMEQAKALAALQPSAA